MSWSLDWNSNWERGRALGGRTCQVAAAIPPGHPLDPYQDSTQGDAQHQGAVKREQNTRKRRNCALGVKWCAFVLFGNYKMKPVESMNDFIFVKQIFSTCYLLSRVGSTFTLYPVPRPPVHHPHHPSWV